jgi:hypothetical protein
MKRTEKKATGSYYTCLSVADYIVNWAITDKKDVILEPSFGDGRFLYSALNRFEKLGNESPNLFGVELQKEPYDKFLADNDKVKCFLGDFMNFDDFRNVDAVIGNPPYVSLKNLSDTNRKKVIDLMKKYGIVMPTSGSLWMPFVIHATELLRKNGRLGFVLPYEITYVRYAFGLWEYLQQNYSKICVYRVYKDFFPEVDVETIIFLAEDKGGTTNNVEYKTFENISNLFDNRYSTCCEIPITDILSLSKPFERELLSPSTKKIINNLRKKGCLDSLVNECKFKIGYVCGNKQYFHPTVQIIKDFSIPSVNLLPCLLNSKDINSHDNIGLDTELTTPKNYLYYPKTITQGDRSYIAYGESNEIHLGYKCKLRSPWYITPAIEIPDVILTVFGDIPKLIANNGGYVVSNSLLCGVIKDREKTDPKELVCRWYNSLTLLMIELYIHSLGGGTLVLIPGEVDKMELLQNFPSDKIETVFSKLNECMLNYGTDATYKLGDSLVLKSLYGFTDHDIMSIRKSLEMLRAWRRPDYRR